MKYPETAEELALAEAELPVREARVAQAQRVVALLQRAEAAVGKGYGIGIAIHEAKLRMHIAVLERRQQEYYCECGRLSVHMRQALEADR